MAQRIHRAKLRAIGGDCNRCGEGFYRHGYCSFCGVNWARPVRYIRRSRPLGGKYGRNSGTVHTSKNK